MVGGSVEATLELWASSLRDVKERIRPLFLQERMAQSADLFLDALLGPERRKTGWMLCSGLSGARRAGCARRRQAIPVLGASRRSWGELSGTRMACGMWCGTTWSRRWLRLMPFWS